MMDDSNLTGLKLLREEFSGSLINKLPKPTKQQTDEVKRDFKAGARCGECGGWHHPKVVHLDYVGHAALTSRFLDVDPLWSWEPMALDSQGLPVIDQSGLLWIRLTICGVTRIGVGDAGSKQGGDAMKERIGDALRNAGMRFGAALDLWHKGDLDQGANDKPKLTASDTHTWNRAIESYIANGHLDRVLASRDISAEDQAAITSQAQALQYEREAQADHKTENQQ